MDQKLEMEVIHPCFGRIRISDKIYQILRLPDFRDLHEKSHLGSIRLSRKFLNANYSRLLHSVGVMALQNQLIEVMQRKYGKYITISQKEREILELLAIGHDVGHGPFSHSLEGVLGKKSHEECTIEIFQKHAKEINKIYGYDICSSVISVMENNIHVKKADESPTNMPTDISIVSILRSLLIGAIDCDRMEYVTTARYMITGQKLEDYSKLFDYITITFLDDSPVVAFEEAALPLIESLLINRFDQYNSLYYNEESALIEMVLREYINKKWRFNHAEFENMSEYEILADAKKALKNRVISANNTLTIKRLANIFLYDEREGIFFKRFDNKSAYEYFMKQLNDIQSDFSGLFICTAEKRTSVYNSKKNRVYIIDKQGRLRDLTEVSQKINNLSIHYYYVMIDLDPIYYVPDEIYERIQNIL